jgi:orotidine-5'-phosphate decarboxylase
MTELIVALDTPDPGKIVNTLGDSVNFYKIGIQSIYSSSGIWLARTLVDNGKKVFLDVKLWDIDNTVKEAIRGIEWMNVNMVTVHSKCLKAALSARTGDKLKIIVPTKLTNENAAPITIRSIAWGAWLKGANGVVVSGHEAAHFRNMITICPAIRSTEIENDDQVRTCTPKQAAENKANYIVVGRQIIQADNPKKEVMKILKEIE